MFVADLPFMELTYRYSLCLSRHVLSRITYRAAERVQKIADLQAYSTLLQVVYGSFVLGLFMTGVTVTP